MQWVQVNRKFSPTVSISGISTLVSYLRPNPEPCSSGSDKGREAGTVSRPLSGTAPLSCRLRSRHLAFTIFLDLSTQNLVLTV